MEDDSQPEKSIWRLLGINKQLRERREDDIACLCTRALQKGRAVKPAKGSAQAWSHFLYGASRCDFGHLMFEYREARAACTLE